MFVTALSSAAALVRTTRRTRGGSAQLLQHRVHSEKETAPAGAGAGTASSSKGTRAHHRGQPIKTRESIETNEFKMTLVGCAEPDRRVPNSREQRSPETALVFENAASGPIPTFARSFGGRTHASRAATWFPLLCGRNDP
jgi:hypothetical protein